MLKTDTALRVVIFMMLYQKVCFMWKSKFVDLRAPYIFYIVFRLG